MTKQAIKRNKVEDREKSEGNNRRENSPEFP